MEKWPVKPEAPRVTCPECKGTGKQGTQGCPWCKGTGKVKSPQLERKKNALPATDDAEISDNGYAIT